MRDGVRMGTKADCRGRNVESGRGQIRPSLGSVQGFMMGLRG